MTRQHKPLLWLLIAWCAVLGLISFGAGVLLSTLLYGDWAWFDHPLTVAVVIVLLVAVGWTSDRTLAWLLRGWPHR